MPTSRPLRDGDFVINLRGGGWAIWRGQCRDGYVLGADFGLPEWRYDYWARVCERIYGLAIDSNVGISAAITNGTAPGLYVREGDDTSDWEVYREVLARRVEEAMAARHGGAGVGVGETTTAAGAQTTRQDDEIRVGDVVEVVSSGGETTRRLAVNPVSPAVSVSLRPRDFNAATITDYLQSLGATHIHLRQSPGNPPVVEVTGLSRQAFNTACQNLPVGVQLRAVGGFLGQRDSGETTTSPTSSSAGIPRGAQSEPPTLPPQSQQPTQQPSRFSLLEVDADPSTADASPSPPQVPKASTGLAALQQELRAEREAKRAPAAAQMPPGRFDLLECDLPAAPAAAKPVKSPQSPRPVVSSSPPPRPRNPVETITDLTAARSPLELARMLEGLNDELSTMMRQREAN